MPSSLTVDPPVKLDKIINHHAMLPARRHRSGSFSSTCWIFCSPMIPGVSALWCRSSSLPHCGLHSLPAASGSGKSSQHAEQQQQQQCQVQSSSAWLGGSNRQQVNSLCVRDHVLSVLQRTDGSHAGVEVSAGDKVKHTRLVVDVSSRKQSGAVSLGTDGGRKQGVCQRQVESLGGGAAPHTQLQVLLGAEGLHDAAWWADRQAERTSALTHHQQCADVSRSDLCVSARTLSLDSEAVMTLPLATRHRAISESSRDVIQLSLVQLLIDTMTPVLKDDGDLWRNNMKQQVGDFDSNLQY